MEYIKNSNVAILSDAERATLKIIRVNKASVIFTDEFNGIRLFATQRVANMILNKKNADIPLLVITKTDPNGNIKDWLAVPSIF